MTCHPLVLYIVGAAGTALGILVMGICGTAYKEGQSTYRADDS